MEGAACSPAPWRPAHVQKSHAYSAQMLAGAPALPQPPKRRQLAGRRALGGKGVRQRLGLPEATDLRTTTDLAMQHRTPMAGIAPTCAAPIPRPERASGVPWALTFTPP